LQRDEESQCLFVLATPRTSSAAALRLLVLDQVNVDDRRTQNNEDCVFSVAQIQDPLKNHADERALNLPIYRIRCAESTKSHEYDRWIEEISRSFSSSLHYDLMI
jgi:hypothetical protein